MSSEVAVAPKDRKTFFLSFISPGGEKEKKMERGGKNLPREI